MGFDQTCQASCSVRSPKLKQFWPSEMTLPISDGSAIPIDDRCRFQAEASTSRMYPVSHTCAPLTADNQTQVESATGQHHSGVLSMDQVKQFGKFWSPLTLAVLGLVRCQSTIPQTSSPVSSTPPVYAASQLRASQAAPDPYRGTSIGYLPAGGLPIRQSATLTGSSTRQSCSYG